MVRVAKKAKKHYPSEYTIQKMCVEWFGKQYPEHYMCLQASLNGIYLGGKDNANIQVSKAKTQGMVVGQSDLFLAVPVGSCPGAYIELKSQRGTESPNQVAFRRHMANKGYKTEVMNSFDKFKEFVDRYLGGE